VTARRKASNRIGRARAFTTAARTSRTAAGAVRGSGITSASRTASDQRDRPTGTSITDIQGLNMGVRSMGYRGIVRSRGAEGNRLAGAGRMHQSKQRRGRDVLPLSPALRGVGQGSGGKGFR